MNDFTKSSRMSCSVFPECIHGFHAPVWTTAPNRAGLMEDVAYWDGQARRFLRRERVFERSCGLACMASIVLLCFGLVWPAAFLLLVAGVLAGLAGRAWMDASAARDFRDWTLRGLGE